MAVPSALEHGALAASWMRCREQFTLDEDRTYSARVLTQAEFAERRAPLEPVLALFQDDLVRLFVQIRDLGYATLLAEPGGTIVHRQCRETDAAQFDRQGSLPGAVWDEAAQGTNGIGTCIALAQPINVHARHHYLQQHRHLSCSGAPVFDIEGRLQLVIDISSYLTEYSDGSHQLALELVRHVARELEERQFRDTYPNCHILLLEHSEQPTTRMLLAVDDQLRIVDADRHARAALGLRTDELNDGIGFAALFSGDASVFRRAGSDDIAIALTHRAQPQHWRGLVTPPLPCRRTADLSARARLHTRPRPSLLTAAHAAAAPSEPRGGLAPAVLHRIRAFIAARVHERITVRALAASAGLSPHHFSRAFKQSVGMTPHCYILQQRVERATSLLTATDWPLADIASATGFADQSHLTRAFRMLMEQSPGEYRRQKSAH